MQPHGLQHAKLPCPSPTPRVCSKSRPCLLYFTANLTLLFNTESPDRRWENEVEGFEGLSRKMQMLFLKKASIFYHGCGHMIPSKQKCPVPEGRGHGQHHSHRVWAVFVIPKCLHNSKTYRHMGQEFLSLLGLSTLAFWFSLDQYRPQGNQVKPLTQ